MTRIRIPDGEHEALQYLARTSREHFDSIIFAMRDARPTMHLPTYVRRVLAKTDLAEDQHLFEALTSTLALANSILVNNTPIADIAPDLGEQLLSGSFLEEDEVGIFQERITHLLSVPNVSLVAQAFHAFVSGSAFYQRAEVASHLNPLYGESSSVPTLSGAVIIHQLILRTSSLSDESMSYRCLLDSDDLKDLRKQIDQALSRDIALREFVTHSGLALVEDASDL